MTDPYRNANASPTSHRPESTRLRALRPVLWLVLAVGVAANVATSAAGVNMMISAGCGLIVLACATALVVDHVRGTAAVSRAADEIPSRLLRSDAAAVSTGPRTASRHRR